MIFKIVFLFAALSTLYFSMSHCINRGSELAAEEKLAPEATSVKIQESLVQVQAAVE